jgi:nitroreductase
MKSYEFVDLNYSMPEPEAVAGTAETHYRFMDKRRSVRDFSDRPVPREVIEHLIMTASSAPSGAHMQPWHFAAVSDPGMKAKIREAAEAEEKLSYEQRMTEEWLEALEPIGTDWQKPFLEIAPWLVIMFRSNFHYEGDRKVKHYYVSESAGIAAGFFIQAVHNAGLVTLTHTPSPMGFLGEILERPEHEKAFLLLPVGYPAEGAQVPKLERKGLDRVSSWH